MKYLCLTAGISHSEDPADAEGDEQLLRVIAYEDLSDYLFSIISEEACFSLVSQFIDFYGGRMAQWFVSYLEYYIDFSSDHIDFTRY